MVPDPKVLALAELHSDEDSSKDALIEETANLVEFEVDQELELLYSAPKRWIVDQPPLQNITRLSAAVPATW